MSSMENGDMELDGTFPNRYVSIPGKVLLMAMYKSQGQVDFFSASGDPYHLLLTLWTLNLMTLT